MYIIVKYAELWYPDGKAHVQNSIFRTYSANEVGVEQSTYKTKEEAASDLAKLIEFNPMVGYGIVEGLE